MLLSCIALASDALNNNRNSRQNLERMQAVNTASRTRLQQHQQTMHIQRVQQQQHIDAINNKRKKR
jgi:hypothetical protein